MHSFFIYLMIAYGAVAFIAHMASSIAQDWLTMFFAGLIIPPIGIIHGTYVLWQMF